jgi:putative dimethyl sulfoxide reductase chaperone
MLDPRRLAEGHRLAYQLFAELLRAGPSAELWPQLEAIPELAEAARPLLAGELAATEHYRLFGLEVFAFENVFLAAEPLVGGERGERLHELYAGSGFQPPGARESPDHVAVELHYLAFLTGLEARIPERAEALRGAQCRFLDEHLLQWLPALVCAIERQAQPFYAAAGSMLLELIGEHRAQLGPPAQAPAEAPAEPPAEQLLDRPETGLAEIAAFLLAPARSGLFLSRGDLLRLGREGDLPVGFGERRTLLRNLLRSAVGYDSLARLAGALCRLADADRRFHERCLPTSPAARLWMERLTGTERLLGRLLEAGSGA